MVRTITDGPKDSRRARCDGVGMAPATLPTTDRPYVLGCDEGEHFHLLNHVATRNVGVTDGAAITAVEYVAPRSFGPPLHVYHDEDEIMVVLDGRIEFRTGDAAAPPLVGDH